jgi:hypothetical protein
MCWSALATLALIATGCADEAQQARDAAERVATTLAEGAEDVRDAAERTATTVEQRAEQATRLRATLSGASEAPATGDPDATGTATLNVDVNATRICYEVSVQKIDRPVGMHIHQGEVGESGPIVVPLTTPSGTDMTTTGCANAEASLVSRITATPGDFYVNVHTDTYPQGAVRGQLSQ